MAVIGGLRSIEDGRDFARLGNGGGIRTLPCRVERFRGVVRDAFRRLHLLDSFGPNLSRAVGAFRIPRRPAVQGLSSSAGKISLELHNPG
jgi:hypothetical protein